MLGLKLSAQPVLLDTRGEVKLECFKGGDAEWGLWALRFESYAGLLGWSDMLEAAASELVEAISTRLSSVRNSILSFSVPGLPGLLEEPEAEESCQNEDGLEVERRQRQDQRQQHQQSDAPGANLEHLEHLECSL